MEAIKRQLRRNSAVYKGLQRVYHGVRKGLETKVLGSRLYERNWEHRAAYDLDDHPHRAFVIQHFERFLPFGSLLEVGCNAGQNLIPVAQKYPAVHLSGLDINPRAIESARVILPDASLFVGRADDLAMFPDRSVDVTLTDATLIYVGPDKIDRVLAELVRVTRKGLILNEWQSPIGKSSEYHFAHWLHDYRSLVAGLSGVTTISVEKLPSGLWADENWQQFGALVQVELSHD